ncbi:translation initiation factor IF-2 [Candidatus Pacearchaeota archaeon]|nr:translation initiation factor IF-2 [Candidatus Pacearchaeota archaeon]|tara:strand:- start:1296 stop:3026 length:1731 start_codon:yes stop_codon:yes gene_type:complete
MESKIRQPIVTVAGHVDHGKTSILDCFRGTQVQEGESGGITQKISFTKYPLEQIKKASPLIESSGFKLEIPGFLFIDTPGHAAFTNLRKRGGSLADLAILVVSVKEGIKPQTAEVLQILKNSKTPFLIALNKVDTISGWQKRDSVKESVESQAINVSQEFQESLLTFQGALQEHGFESDLYWEISDFSKKVAIVPCSAKTKEGIPELLFVLSGLSEKYLKERLKLGETGKGVVLEVRKEKSGEKIETILFDGTLSEGDEIAIASFDSIIETKVRALEEIQSLSFRYKSKKEASAATGLRLQLTNKENVLSGMPFQVVKGNIKEIEKEFKKEISGEIKLDKQGIIVKADSLGSLEALLTLLRQEQVKVVKAGIGPIGKTDMISAKANLEINELDAVIVGFNVDVDEDLGAPGKVVVLRDEVVYKLIEDLQKWRKEKQEEIEREKMLGLATICKLEILPQYVFRNSNPAVFGVRVSNGKIVKNTELIDETGDSVARVKDLQLDKESVDSAEEGKELAVSLPGTNFERRLKDKKYLYANISAKQFRDFKKNKELLSEGEKKVLQEIAEIKRKKDDDWGM